MLWKLVKKNDKNNAQSQRYYISGDGDDDNDGLHPLRAWKTIERLNMESKRIKEYDQIFFQRGHIYRGYPFYSQHDKTYNIRIYGSGELPSFPDIKNENQ